MKKKLLDISNKLNIQEVELLEKIHKILTENEINYYIIGAYARDIILHHFYGREIYRKTNDVDFGIRVKDWETFYSIKECFKENGFECDNKIMHRMYYKGLTADLVCFGGVEQADSKIIWPDKDRTEMSVLGFENAYMHSIPIKVRDNPELILNFTSLEGIVSLKFISWKDSPSRRTKDAQDIYLIMNNYLDAGNYENLFEECPDISDKYTDTDLELITARYLGRKVASMADSEVVDAILHILDDKESLNNLARDMITDKVVFDDYDYYMTRAKELLNALCLGLRD